MSVKELIKELKHSEQPTDILAAKYLQELLDQNIRYKDDNIRLQRALKTERNLVGEMVDRVKEKEYTLIGVMHYVDKWLEGDELNQDECNRAATMREKVLRIIEDLAKQLKEQPEKGLNELQDQLVKAKDECKVFREYYIRVSNLPDCNTCQIKKDCEYLPQWGESVRINCPHFVGGENQ